jgi:hypothetical protein
MDAAWLCVVSKLLTALLICVDGWVGVLFEDGGNTFGGPCVGRLLSFELRATIWGVVCVSCGCCKSISKVARR